MWRTKPWTHFLPRLALLVLLLAVGWFYAPTLHFGFIWDDPQWFGRVAGKGWLALLRPFPDFQFYRPGTMLYNRLFLRADGTFAALPLHAAQIGWHLLNTSLLYAISRRLGLARWSAVAAAALFAAYPFAYQAVSWAAPQQPLALALQNSAWLVFLLAQQHQPAHRLFLLLLGGSALLFFLALTVQESTLPLAFVPLLFTWLRYPGASVASFMNHIWRGNGRYALIFPLLAAVYGLFWLQAPRQGGITGLYAEPEVFLYLLQGFIYPLAGRPGGYAPGQVPSGAVLAGMGLLVVVALAIAARWQRQGRLALVGGAWALLGILPPLLGLPFSYVSLGARLLYYAAPGVAWLWVAALNGRHRGQQAGGLLLVLIIGHSAWMLVAQQRLQQPGIAHMREMVTEMAEKNGRFLFINFPDRYAPVQPFYPLGYWGVTLAPVVSELHEFVAMEKGAAPVTSSLSVPWIDQQEREAGPYAVDMRGVIVTPEELYAAANNQSGIYLSRYEGNGRFRLELAGLRETAVTDDVAPTCALAQFGDALCLQDVAVKATGSQWEILLTWLRLPGAEVSPFTTPFLHLGTPGQPPVAQADGDAWRGMLPAAVWQPGDLVHDARSLPRSPQDDALSLQIGVYDWVTGERAPGVLVAGQRPLPDNAFSYPLRP